VTGGVLSFGQIGALLGPSAFALLLRLTGGYGIGWALGPMVRRLSAGAKGIRNRRSLSRVVPENRRSPPPVW
jgi:hypothetical protein